MKKSVYFIGVMFFIAPYVSYAMDFEFLNNGKIQKISINCGDKWNSIKTDSKFLNTVFQQIDDGDNVVSQLELDTLDSMYQSVTRNGEKKFSLNDENISNFDFDKLKTLKTSVVLASELYDCIHEKDLFIFPTTGKDIDKKVFSVNKDNVYRVLDVYYKKTGGTESLFSGIMSEYGLDIDERLKYVKHIFTQFKLFAESCDMYADDLLKSFEKELVKQKDSWGPASAENIDRIIKQMMKRSVKTLDNGKTNYLPNGKIDEDFIQGGIGDCWLLAAIKSVSKSPKGMEILDNTVKVNGNNVTVKLKGVDKSYIFTIDEIKNSGHLATGDLDVRAIEMAINTYITEEGALCQDEVDINSNVPSIAFQLLTGKTVEHKYKIGSTLDLLDDGSDDRYGLAHFTTERIKKFNKTNHVACVSAEHKSAIKYKLPNNQILELLPSHTYSVSRSDDKYVYLIDPWGTKEEYGTEEIPVDIETFCDFFNTINEFDL